jgi:hypothetical protein
MIDSSSFEAALDVLLEEGDNQSYQHMAGFVSLLCILRLPMIQVGTPVTLTTYMMFLQPSGFLQISLMTVRR